MLSPLPPEILDLIVDQLHDEPTALKACCTVSKSWVSCARAHLFADVEFSTTSPIELWMRAFPDPSNSPAHYARNLSVDVCSLLPTTSMDARIRFRSFHQVTKLKVYVTWYQDDEFVSFAQLHSFSPALKSLDLNYSSSPPSEVINLICSFPSLEDLSLSSWTVEKPKGGWTIPSTSPRLTGELLLTMHGQARPDVRQLLDLLGGLHFSRISMSCPDKDAESTAVLVSMCSDTLESLRIHHYCPDPGASTAPLPLDLSKTARLKDVELHWDVQTVQWITRTLQTAKSEYLRQITICALSPTDPIQATVRQEWEDLDHVLVQLVTLRSIRLKLDMDTSKCDDPEAQVQLFFPELASRVEFMRSNG